MTETDGTQIAFWHEPYQGVGFYRGSGTIDYIDYVQYPEGERLTFANKLEWSQWCENGAAAVASLDRTSAPAGASQSAHYAHSNAGSVRTTTVTDPLGHLRTVISNLATGLVTNDTDALGHATSYTYDGYGRVTTVTLPELNTVFYSYDARGNATQSVLHAKPGSGLADITTSATYSTACASAVNCNRPLTTTDPRGAVTDHAWDLAGSQNPVGCWFIPVSRARSDC